MVKGPKEAVSRGIMKKVARIEFDTGSKMKTKRINVLTYPMMYPKIGSLMGSPAKMTCTWERWAFMLFLLFQQRLSVC
jgi:hypothetical protein